MWSTRSIWGGRHVVRRVRGFWGLIVDTIAGALEDKAPRLGAALAYYTVLALAPVLVLVAPVAETIFGQAKARNEIVQQFADLVGQKGAEAVQSVLTAAATRAQPGTAAKALSVVVLLFGASGVFAELQETLDTIWEVAPKPGRAAVWGVIRKRLLSFAMVMGICFLLLVSLVISAALASVQHFADVRYQSLARVWGLAHTTVSVVVVTILFAMIFKVLPDVILRWRDVIVGAALTAALFTLGRYALGEYLGKTSIGERYGAAGSLVVVLVWVYYSAQILVLGAEFTKAWTRRSGARIKPEAIAVPVTEEARAQQGITHRDVVEAVKDVTDQKIREEEADAQRPA